MKTMKARSQHYHLANKGKIYRCKIKYDFYVEVNTHFQKFVELLQAILI